MSNDTEQGVWDFLEDGGLLLPPVKSKAHPEGKAYRIPSPDAETGIFLVSLTNYMAQQARDPDTKPDERVERRIQAFLDARTAEVGDDDDAAKLEASGRLVLGETAGELVADGVEWVIIQRLTKYAMLHFTQGPEAAKTAALSGALVGGAMAPANRAARRAKGKPKTQRKR